MPRAGCGSRAPPACTPPPPARRCCTSACPCVASLVVPFFRLGRGDPRRSLDDRKCNAQATRREGGLRAASHTQTLVTTSIRARQKVPDRETPFREGNGPSSAATKRPRSAPVRGVKRYLMGARRSASRAPTLPARGLHSVAGRPATPARRSDLVAPARTMDGPAPVNPNGEAAPASEASWRRGDFPARYHVLASDYDGTLAHHGELLDTTRAALERLKATGRKLLMVTGRRVDDLLTTCPDLSPFDCIVAENGAVLYFPATREFHPLVAPPPPIFAERRRGRGVPGGAAGGGGGAAGGPGGAGGLQ